ncbi:MAG: hypothetical protein ABIS50_00525 [Luteolibacter sp.]|uniref:hypothetical protein n=1 Tax=Luteolibacter sp. TaxID=1962973 RepID=UPI003265313C
MQKTTPPFDEGTQDSANPDKSDLINSPALPLLGDPIYDLGPDSVLQARQNLRVVESIPPADEEQRRAFKSMVTPRTLQPLDHEDAWDDWHTRSRDPHFIQDLWQSFFGDDIPIMSIYEMRALIRDVNSRLSLTWPERIDPPCMSDCYDPVQGRYWRQGRNGHWNSYTTRQYANRLFRLGRRSIQGPGESRTEIQSDVEAVTENQAMITRGMSGFQSGIHDVEGRLHLARYGYKMIEPDDTIHPIKTLDWLTELLGDDGIRRLLDWLHHAISALLEGRRGQSRILIIAGPPSCGKSFLIREIIRLLLGGRAADAAPWLLGTTDFASELGGAELLYVDDALGDGRLATRLGVAAKQKQIVTAGSKPQPMHAKGKDRYSHPVWWRHAGALNDTPEALSMLPPIDEGYGDKLILLRASDTVLSAGGDGVAIHIDAILAELPGFMAFVLKNGGDGPCDGRGPLAWHDPELAWKLREAAPEYSLAGMILEAIDGGDTYGGLKKPLIEPTLSDLDRALRNACGERYSRLCPTDRVTRKYLGRLAVDEAVSSRMLNGRARWNLEKLSSWIENQNSTCRQGR